MKNISLLDKNLFLDGMLGLAVADAMGVPYEFSSLDEMQANPCTDMVGYRYHNQPAGSWSDDTSMALCTADSLCKGFDPDDMMKKFSLWKNKRQYTATGVVFDVGRTCRRAIDKYTEGCPVEFCGDNTINGNGNGGLMRIFPVALYMHFTLSTDDDHLEQFLEPIHIASSLTHAHEIGLICCGLFSLTLREWLQNTNSSKTLLDIAQSAFEKGKMTYNCMGGAFKDEINRPGQFTEPKNLFHRSPEELPSWGYALNTWNIALWSLITTDNYRDCVLKAVNVGGDTDSNAAVAGALAGIIYGKENIPEEWIRKLKNENLIELISSKLYQTLFGKNTAITEINSFTDEYAFLAMKAFTNISLDGIVYGNVAAAYFAQAVPEEYRWDFTNLNSKQARKHYKGLPHITSMEQCKEERLYRAVKAKYEQHSDLLEKLLATGDLSIVYDTTGSHDNELGHCLCKNCRDKEYQNVYGKVLMRVREELK